jgi:cytidine kinase
MVAFWGFDIIIDDIVMPDGTTSMGKLGGGGPQATYGMRLWSESVGLVASVGPDLPPDAMAWLKQAGIYSDAIQINTAATPRAWQIMEEDGRRAQIWRVPPSAVDIHLTHTIDRIPTDHPSPTGFHIGVDPLDVEFDFLGDLKQTEALVSIETYTPAHRQLTRDELERLVAVPDIFSFNLEEAYSMLGKMDPLDLLEAVLSAGATIAMLRMGAKGSLIGARATDQIIYVPAVQVEVVNPIGAGNAFCGGFLVGFAADQDVIKSGAFAAVSASFMVEQNHLPDITPKTFEVAEQRLKQSVSSIETITRY